MCLAVLGTCLVVSAQAKTVVRVAAAANLRYVMEQIEKLYERENSQIDLQINYGASGTFYQQIINGAPFNLFLSADDILPDKLKSTNLTIGNARAYACGQLAIYSLRRDVARLGLSVLEDKSLKRISIANPQTAPYGSRSVELLKALGLWSGMEKKVVYGESIAQAAQFALTGNVDVGFVALSLLLNPETTLKGSYFIIPQKNYKPIAQAGVQIKQKTANQETKAFFDFILSDKCTVLWDKFGYFSAK